jgi:hypothetical protein
MHGLSLAISLRDLKRGLFVLRRLGRTRVSTTLLKRLGNITTLAGPGAWYFSFAIVKWNFALD